MLISINNGHINIRTISGTTEGKDNIIFDGELYMMCRDGYHERERWTKKKILAKQEKVSCVKLTKLFTITPNSKFLFKTPTKSMMKISSS